MTDMPNGSLSVDSEGVKQLGDAYTNQLATYEGHLQQLEDLRARYRSAWGDDDMGKQFQKQFDALADTLKGLISSVKKSLDYTSTGLHLNGDAYEKADEGALKGSQMLLGGMTQLKAPASPEEDVRVLRSAASDDRGYRAIPNDEPKKFFRLLLPSDGLTVAKKQPLHYARASYIHGGPEGHGEYHPGVPQELAWARRQSPGKSLAPGDPEVVKEGTPQLFRAVSVEVSKVIPSKDGGPPLAPAHIAVEEPLPPGKEPPAPGAKDA